MEGSINLHLDAAVTVICSIMLRHLPVCLEGCLPSLLFFLNPVTPGRPLNCLCFILWILWITLWILWITLIIMCVGPRPAAAAFWWRKLTWTF